MSTDNDIHEMIEQTADEVGPVWPLHSFVTANPLAGFEDRPFHEAVAAGERLFGGDGYPSADAFRRAWERGAIEPGVLESRLADHGYAPVPETHLDSMAASDGDDPAASDAERTATDRVDDLMTKWLAAFLDQGKAHWPMPNREQGFYVAVRTTARHDGDIPDSGRLADLPSDPAAAIENLLADHPESEWPAVFEHHLAALPGWTGLVKQRVADDGDWQSAYPITLTGYVAVRLAITDLVGAPMHPEEAATTAAPTAGDETATDDAVPLEEVWLSAWEASYREELVDAVTDASEATVAATDGGRPDAQFVFCIDTRSEVIRRHIESTGDYETHGYAGFFGIPMRYDDYDSEVAVDACPPILDAQHYIADRQAAGDTDVRATHDRWRNVADTATNIVDALKTNAATAFSFVETAGSGYGAALAARTLLPARVYDLLDTADERVPDDHEFCEPSVDHAADAATDLPAGLTLDEKVEYAATAFELMGWEQFARVVVFAGHASETTNNPFDSSLDCGACAGNPGGPSARVLATICNEEAVKAELRDRGFDVPDDTLFVAGEHNTTTDEVELFADDVPESHADDVAQLRADLETARSGAAAERAAEMGAEAGGARETERRAADWAETRPEWGLAGNAGFVIGPRALTEGFDLDGRAFLHSYDWSTDPDGDALEAIFAGPLVVTQWINTQYYFATVDTAVYGSGSKVTHNPVGNVGVYQGNGGDLMTGLPLQSLKAADDEPYHQPLRLSAVVHAPVERVTGILADHEKMTELLDNGWLSLTVVDPTQQHRAFHYEEGLEWTPASSGGDARPQAPNTPTVADD
ncbi:DUF2309 domain-containing protein [Halorarius halobius]|uniref:DUF2309 domain-containing protein n=1 Tax=Halorarius halobius TaxID=2962671 RepID=UPI0020CC73E0|nr:DUF2309 domain-containing protein [Halorarius halobius]